MRLFSTEQVSKWHPDKYADQISDAILTACLAQDKHSHCGIETMVKDDIVVLSGEITSGADIDVQSIVERVAAKLGYPVSAIFNFIGRQSPEIGAAVDSDPHIGAGDQGMMYGYATRETDSKLPYGFDLANRIIAELTFDKENNPGSILKGDAKCQVTVDLDAPKDVSSVKTVLVSVCHKEGLELEEVRSEVLRVLEPLGVPESAYLINPAGLWTIGGPTADAGLTGRKIVCDQYGGYCPVGGGAFSGKDPSKVDRSGAYIARTIACLLLDEHPGWEWCEVQMAYAIGVAEPVSVCVSNDKGEAVPAEELQRFDLTPFGIIKALGLCEVDYESLAEGCHYR